MAIPSRAAALRLLLPVAGLALVLWLLPGRGSSRPVEHYQLAMGTLVKIVLYADEAAAPAAMDSALAQIGIVDSLASRYTAASEANRIGARAGTDTVMASAPVVDVIERSSYFARVTGGAFDPTVGPLTSLWGFPDAVAPPAAAAIDSALALVEYGDLVVDGDRVYLRRPGMRLDLGAAAKGYAVDRAVEALIRAGVEAGLVEAGGDIRFWGRKPDGEPWRFGVRHPRVPDCTVLSADVGLASLATSGDYEQAFEHEGVTYHHILDPATGRPARGTVSATAWAPTAIDADILSTALFVLGPDEAMKLVEGIDGVEALLFFETAGRLEYVHSPGLNGYLQFPDCARN